MVKNVSEVCKLPVVQCNILDNNTNTESPTKLLIIEIIRQKI